MIGINYARNFNIKNGFKKMKNVGAFVYTLLTSSFIYLLTYLLLTQNKHNEIFAVASMFFGFSVYLIIRVKYKSNQDHDVRLAKAYRLLLWILPMLVISVYSIFFIYQFNQQPEYSDYYSFEDLKWSSFLIIVLWPVFNFFVALKNLIIIFLSAIAIFGIPVLIGINILVMINLILLIKKLVKLKNEKALQISLINATFFVLMPYIIFIFIVVMSNYIHHIE